MDDIVFMVHRYLKDGVMNLTVSLESCLEGYDFRIDFTELNYLVDRHLTIVLFESDEDPKTQKKLEVSNYESKEYIITVVIDSFGNPLSAEHPIYLQKHEPTFQITASSNKIEKKST